MCEYRVESRDGGFAVYTKEPARVRVTMGDGQGGLSVAVAEARRVFKCSEQSVFYTYYKGDGLWFTDSEAGMQRYVQDRTTREIKAALRKCGFAKGEIREIVHRAKKGRK